jgi:hypothetical protein
MSDTNDDPIILHLRERKATLEAMVRDIAARLAEVCDLLDQLSDGRTRVRRRLREVQPPEAPPELVA